MDPLSPDVTEIRAVLERSLVLHPNHAGLCHSYVHLCEMSNHPSDALPACEVQPRKREHYHARRLQCHQEIDVSRTLTNLEYDGDNEMNRQMNVFL